MFPWVLSLNQNIEFYYLAPEPGCLLDRKLLHVNNAKVGDVRSTRLVPTILSVQKSNLLVSA